MNKDQAEHLERVSLEAVRLIQDKYIRGAREHKTTLNKDHTVEELLDFAIEEATDQMTYLLTLKEKLHED